MGALSTLVEVNKFKSVVYNKIVNRAQLGRASAEDNISQYWQLISGHCLFGLLDEEIINMIEGDLVFIPHGSAHWIADKAISIRIPAAEYTKAKMAGIPPHSGANEEQRPSAAASRALCKHPGDCRVRRQTSIPIPLFRL